MKSLFGIEVEDNYFDYLFAEHEKGKDLKVINGKVVAVEHEVTDEELTQKEIYELEARLKATDYIASKLAEANAEYILTEDKTKLIELRTKYAKELVDREAWRTRIDTLREIQ